VKIFGLAKEYWRPKILFAIASSVGTPICTDAESNKSRFDRSFGHFARVLVDIYLTTTLRYKVLVERKGFAFFVELGYENLPNFCDKCKIIGHASSYCKRFPDKAVDQEIKKVHTKKTFVVKDPNKKQGSDVGDLEAEKINEGKQPLTEIIDLVQDVGTINVVANSPTKFDAPILTEAVDSDFEPSKGDPRHSNDDFAISDVGAHSDAASFEES
jgi:hypothetical protein